MENKKEPWIERNSNKVMVALVYASLFLDNVLLTAVVPIIPDFLYELEHPTDGSSELAFFENMTYTSNQSSLLRFYPRPIGRPRKSDVSEENDEVGVLLSSKAFIQLFSNGLVAIIINRIGYSGPLIGGSIVILASSLIFAFGKSYISLFAARSVQGFGSACIAISGMTVIAERYTEDKQRSSAMGIALGGIAAGVLAGYPFGSTLYDFFGKMAPFLILSVLMCVNCCTVFIPDSCGYLVGTNCFGTYALRVGRWKTALVALLMVGSCAITIPMASHVLHLLIPHFGLGLGIGIADAALMPLLATLVDSRHNASYGSVFAFAQVAVCLAYSIGPLVGSHLVAKIGFPWVIRSVGLVNLAYSPLCILLRRTLPEEIKPIVLSSSTTSYDSLRDDSAGIAYQKSKTEERLD